MFCQIVVDVRSDCRRCENASALNMLFQFHFLVSISVPRSFIFKD